MNTIQLFITQSITAIQVIALLLVLSLIIVLWKMKWNSMTLLFYLPSTILHELSHLLIAFVLGGNPSAISLIPKKEGKHYILGTVTFLPKWYNALFVGFAPLSLWGIAGYLFITNNVLIVSPLFYWLLVGGMPSRQDIKIGIKHSFGIILFLLLVFGVSYQILNK